MKSRISSASYFFIISMVVLGIAACGGGKVEILDRPPQATDIINSDPPLTNSPQTNSGGISSALLLRDKIEALERGGKIRKLDRTDTLAGVDGNQDGVRDDIAAFISELPLSAEQKRAFMQEARALQATIFVDLTDKVALQKSGDRTMAAINCSGDRMPEDFYIVGEKIQAMTFNTNLRLRRFMQYNAARSGSVTSMPNNDTCE